MNFYWVACVGAQQQCFSIPITSKCKATEINWIIVVNFRVSQPPNSVLTTETTVTDWQSIILPEFWGKKAKNTKVTTYEPPINITILIFRGPGNNDLKQTNLSNLILATMIHVVHICIRSARKERRSRASFCEMLVYPILIPVKKYSRQLLLFQMRGLCP